ncbi:BatA domain-containing protein [Gelidibacter maritimus]|uniref:BatA domain-containing protein n=1 Tax=Gelidibacter maritimus TaxID=2761487 RepID=A0A7W2M6I2_9FLAO|nr:BatA domain-containing protein [Gelidibacter maritimus]MBA6153616.1 BatA domain-containing protein [Gelidibacter maritimus]
MQFKNPEILYALLLLIIPIIVHLFQLRRFEKVTFTNVQFLKNIILKTRKSSQIKKWLTLLTRLLLLTCLIIAFAQPYQANQSSFTTTNETVIYLDNSFSMQAKGDNGTLLNAAVQDLIEHVDENESISLFTNDLNFSNTTIKAIQNDLIELSYSPYQMDYEAVILKGKKAFTKDKGSVKNLVLISDFQQKNEVLTLDKDSLVNYRLVQLQPRATENVSIDSLYISKDNVETLELTVMLSNQGNPIETLSISLFEDQQLMAKSAVSIDDKIETIFTIPNNKAFKGKVVIDDVNLNYDNTLHFNIDKKDRIKVLAINDANADFLRKLYTTDEFELTIVNFKDLNYNIIVDQNLIVLNELQDIPNALSTSLKSFSENGGSILIIPSTKSDTPTYNQLFSVLSLPRFTTQILSEKRITKINFSHPLLKNVFNKTVANFQYPKVNSFYRQSNPSGASVLSFEDNATFLAQFNNIYAFSASLDENNSNFKNSPLIVPVLYNIGKQSLKLPQLYYTIGITNIIDINANLLQDEILKLENAKTSMIPMQQTFSNKVQIITDENPKSAGIFKVKNKEKVLQHLSYNYNRNESQLNYLNVSQIKNSTNNSSVAAVIDDIKSTTNINELWKWFVIFAIAFLIIEMLILKLLK